MSEGGLQLKHKGSRRQVVVAGAVAGLVSRFVVAPLDVIKIRLQLQIHSLSNPLSVRSSNGYACTGSLGVLSQLLREEGITGLWKGNVPAALMYLMYGSIQFSAYRYMSHMFECIPSPYIPPDNITSFFSGAVAGAAATTVTYPFDLLRTRFAAQGTDRVYTSLPTAIKQISQQEGPTGFFRGLTAGVSQIVPYMGLFFASYETMRPIVANLSVPLPFGSSDAVTGVIASILSKSAVYPLDTARKRLQVQGPTRARYIHRNIPAYTGVLNSLLHTWQHEGRRGMYRGLTVSLLKAAPTSAVTMWTYERVIDIMLSLDEPPAGN